MKPIRKFSFLIILFMLLIALAWQAQAMAEEQSVSNTIKINSEELQPNNSILVNLAWTAESDQASARFGYTGSSSAGDVNGDGYDDVIVGAPYYDNGQTDEGRAYVFYGSATGLSVTPNWTVESNQTGALYGWNTGTAGDVNGDGYDDVIVSAIKYDNGQTDEGRVFVYHGSATGLSTIPSWTAESDQANSYLGFWVGTAGDVNGDGYDDIIVGAELFDNGQTDEGRAFVYHGSSTGLSLSPNWTAESNQVNAQFGESVGTAGDVNGDGYDEVIIGAPYYDNGQTDEGRAFVYHGSSTGLSLSPNWTVESDQGNAHFGISAHTAGDVNGDGYDDVIVGAYSYDNGQTDEGRAFVYHGSFTGLSLSPNWIVESDQAGSQFGLVVNSAGDVNGDGYDDVIVGAKDYDNGQVDEGRAFGYSGSSSGLSTLADWTTESDQASAEFTYMSADTAGDVNGDGYDDVIVGAPYYDNGQTDEGRAFVYYIESGGVIPNAPTLLPINNPNGNVDYLVDWSGVAGATSYRLEEDDNSTFTSPSVRYTGTNSQFQVYGQDYGKWYYRVRASNTYGDSPWSSTQTVNVGMWICYLPFVVRNH
jgi:hypothetical protein